jgi:hypothetical protein
MSLTAAGGGPAHRMATSHARVPEGLEVDGREYAPPASRSWTTLGSRDAEPSQVIGGRFSRGGDKLSSAYVALLRPSFYPGVEIARARTSS